jgi:coenzyme PQQ precursor peptide PqqA
MAPKPPHVRRAWAPVFGAAKPLDGGEIVLYDWRRSTATCSSTTREGTIMTWEAPDFVEVRMDAEINSYQDDFGGEQDDRF